MVLIDLAEQGQEKPVSLRSVAERQGISEKYLEGIVARLGAANLVDSIRGKYGVPTMTAETPARRMRP